jgi:hypothetical protein
MALATVLEKGGLNVESANTNAALTFELTDAGFTITTVNWMCWPRCRVPMQNHLQQSPWTPSAAVLYLLSSTRTSPWTKSWLSSVIHLVEKASHSQMAVSAITPSSTNFKEKYI